LNEARLCYPKARDWSRRVASAQSIGVRVRYIGPRPEHWHKHTSDFVMHPDGAQDFTIDEQWGK
jgi:hypothetical protein